MVFTGHEIRILSTLVGAMSGFEELSQTSISIHYFSILSRVNRSFFCIKFCDICYYCCYVYSKEKTIIP